MVVQPEKFCLETGTWMQYDTFVEEICNEGNYSKEDVESKLNELISNRNVQVMHISTNKYINFDSAVSKYQI